MYDNYCTLEEAWGKDFRKDDKKRKERETQGSNIHYLMIQLMIRY